MFRCSPTAPAGRACSPPPTCRRKVDILSHRIGMHPHVLRLQRRDTGICTFMFAFRSVPAFRFSGHSAPEEVDAGHRWRHSAQAGAHCVLGHIRRRRRRRVQTYNTRRTRLLHALARGHMTVGHIVGPAQQLCWRCRRHLWTCQLAKVVKDDIISSREP